MATSPELVKLHGRPKLVCCWDEGTLPLPPLSASAPAHRVGAAVRLHPPGVERRPGSLPGAACGGREDAFWLRAAQLDGRRQGGHFLACGRTLYAFVRVGAGPGGRLQELLGQLHRQAQGAEDAGTAFQVEARHSPGGTVHPAWIPLPRAHAATAEDRQGADRMEP